jgi:hypothetical protein
LLQNLFRCGAVDFGRAGIYADFFHQSPVGLIEGHTFRAYLGLLQLDHFQRCAIIQSGIAVEIQSKAVASLGRAADTGLNAQISGLREILRQSIAKNHTVCQA